LLQLDEFHAVLGHGGHLGWQARLRNFTLQSIDPMAASLIPFRREVPPVWTTPEMTPPPGTLPGWSMATQDMEAVSPVSACP
jgi:hypothetical protein